MQYKFLNIIIYTLIINILSYNSLYVRSHESKELSNYCNKTLNYNKCIKSLEANSGYPYLFFTPWRSYGPLKINWSQWKQKDNSYVTLALNKNLNVLFIALTCKKNQINVTNKDTKWLGWQAPESIFEKNIIYDFCTNIKN